MAHDHRGVVVAGVGQFYRVVAACLGEDAAPVPVRQPRGVRPIRDGGPGRRPGSGEIAGYDFDKVVGKRLTRAVTRNTQLTWSDLSDA